MRYIDPLRYIASKVEEAAASSKAAMRDPMSAKPLPLPLPLPRAVSFAFSSSFLALSSSS